MLKRSNDLSVDTVLMRRALRRRKISQLGKATRKKFRNMVRSAHGSRRTFFEKSMDFLQESLRPSVEWEVLLYRTCALIAVASRLRTTLGGSPQGMERSSAIGGVRIAASTIGGLRTGCWSYKTVWIFEKPKFFEHTPPRKECPIT